MSTIQADIVEWAAGRPGWQQTLLRDLAGSVAIDDERLETILGTLMESPDAEGSTLREEDLPVATSVAESVLLLAVGDIENVNALATGGCLSFAASGLTVVYGDNASGKSGFARPVKAAVSSLHREDVHGDVFAADPHAPQRARIDYRRGGKDLDCTWPDSLAPELAAVHFYDEACGDTYLQSESELSYRPSALVLLDGLIAVCEELRRRIDARLAENAAATQALPIAPEGSTAASFLAGLDGATTDAEIDAAAELAPGSEKRHADLTTEEARLKTTDPQKEKDRLRALAKDLHTIAGRLASLEAELDDEALDEAQTAIDSLKSTRAAARLASQGSFTDEPLAGVGSETWRVLWRAARGYSEAEAYPEREFPVTEDASCVLCQQPLGPEGSDRLERFDAFVSDETAKELAGAEAAVRRKIDSLEALERVPPGLAEALARFAGAEEELAGSVSAWLAAAESRRLALLARLAEADPEPEILALGTSPRETVLARAKALEDEAEAVDAEGFKASLAALAAEREDIEGRRLIAGHREVIADERGRRLARERLQAAKKRADTSAASRRIGELADLYVTADVRDRFTRESDRLGLERIELKKQSTRKGKVRHKPGLLGATSSKPVSEILSEGEQTALGLAGFFTEAHFDPSRSALVLDDPVSSLDHIRRAKVADRLAQLSSERQVVIFTHDLEFVVALSAAAKREGVGFTERSIERRGDKVPGVCVDHHPWKAKDVGRRISELEQRLAEIERERGGWSQDTYEERCAEWAGRLSEAWERLLHLEIARPLVDLPATEVRPKMLRVISRVSEEDEKQFQASYGRVSEWARRHDKSPAHNYVAPEPSELVAELDSIREFFARVKKYKD